MPEQSPNIVLAPEAPKLTPLDSQNYKDYQAQRKIIGFLGSNDPRVLDMDFYPITRVQKVDFSEGIMEGRYEAPQLRDMLESIGAPLTGGVVQENYTDLVARIEGFGDIERRLIDFIGKDGADHLTPGDMARFLIKYPTPFDVDDYVESALSQAQNESGIDGRIGLEEALKLFLEGIYGDQFKYWQNFKILADEAFKDNEPREVSKVFGKKRLGAKATVAAATAMAVSGFAGGMHQAIQPNTDNTPEPTVQLAPEVTPTPEPTPEPTPQSSPESERAKYEREIEEKYGILLLNNKEGFEYVGQVYNENNEDAVGDEPPVRWPMEKLASIDDVLSYVPPRFLVPLSNGKLFAISLWDYGNENNNGSARMHHDGYEL